MSRENKESEKLIESLKKLNWQKYYSFSDRGYIAEQGGFVFTVVLELEDPNKKEDTSCKLFVKEKSSDDMSDPVLVLDDATESFNYLESEEEKKEEKIIKEAKDFLLNL